MRRPKLALAVVLAVALGLLRTFFQPPSMEVWMLDVGQGESVLVREPNGRLLLFDGGPDDRVLSQLGAVLPFWKRDIDLVVLSHTHLDHVAGLNNVLARYSVREAWISGAADTSSEYREFESQLAKYRIPVRHRFWSDLPCSEVCPAVEPFGAAHLQLYHPMEDMTGKRLSQAHDADLVVKVSWLAQSILLTGDLNEEHERDMLAACRPPSCTLRATVLQVPHHGSATGLSPAFLAAVNPKAALIPVGLHNRYGHPTAAILKRLAETSVPTYRTDLQGRIRVQFSETGFTVSREKDG